MSTLNYNKDLTNNTNDTNSDYIINNYSYIYSEVSSSTDNLSNLNNLSLENKLQNQFDNYTITPIKKDYQFRTQIKVPKVGLLLVGLGGNNGTTVLGGIIANKLNLSWNTKNGENKPNFYGSI